MRIIIVGAGKVGTALTEQLCRGNEVTVIDRKKKLIDNIINIYDVIGFCGNALDHKLQQEAHVGEAELLIACTTDDETNILTCLVARKLGVQHTIARVRNPENEEMLYFMQKELGLSMAINPEKAAAREIARVLRFPAAMKVETFSGGRLELVEYRIPGDSALHGMPLSQLSRASGAKVLICAVTRNGATSIPAGDFILQSGDTVYLSAAPQQMSRFFRYLKVFRRGADSVIIAGASRICHYLTQELLDMGTAVTIVDPDEQRCIDISRRFPRATVLVGDATDSELLQEAGIRHTDAFVAITGSDEANILMCLSVAQQAESCKVVAKINRRSMVDFVCRSGMIDSIVSASVVISEPIAQYVRAMQNASGDQVRTLHRLAGGAVEAVSFRVPATMPYVGIPLKNLPLRTGLLLSGIVRSSGQLLIPGGEDVLLVDDEVMVVSNGPDLRDIRDIFR